MNWTQPICLTCWGVRNPGRVPIGLTGRAIPETCCDCGKDTREGVYIRLDPRSVAYPRGEED